MSDAMIFFIAIFVFTLLIIGLVLTVLEFRFGEPAQQDEEARQEGQESDRKPTGNP